MLAGIGRRNASGEVEDAGGRGGADAPRGWAAWSSELCNTADTRPLVASLLRRGEADMVRCLSHRPARVARRPLPSVRREP